MIYKRMKKLLTFMLSMLLTLTITGCSTTSQEDKSDNETVTITSLNADGEEIQLEVPYDPERVAILDMAALEIAWSALLPLH